MVSPYLLWWQNFFTNLTLVFCSIFSALCSVSKLLISCCPWAVKWPQILPICPLMSATNAFPQDFLQKSAKWQKQSVLTVCRFIAVSLEVAGFPPLSAAAALSEPKATGLLTGTANFLHVSVNLSNVSLPVTDNRWAMSRKWMHRVGFLFV